MVCKTNAHGKGEFDCMREGRKVTRCAASVSVYFFLSFHSDTLFGQGGEGQERTEFTGIRLEDINKSCLEEFRQHWMCLEDNNQQLWQCRRPERRFNSCVFDKLVRLVKLVTSINDQWLMVLQKLEKTIPGAPEGETPVHLRERQIYSQNP